MLLNFQNPLTSFSRLRRRWLIARSRIFDRKWYLAEYPESGVPGLDPIMHYLLSGADRGYRPHLLFDPAWYMNARGPRQRDQNPLIDYINYGAREGIEPSPYFATAFYRKAAGGTGGLTPLGHFVAYGLPRGLAPTPLFDRAWYLENNPDVRRAGFDPFLHFVASGGKDGRSPGPLFDSTWYRMKNADARDEGMEPLHHYLAIGAREGRDPCRFFDTEFYVAAHPGQGAARETALAFYAERGRDGWHSTHPVLPPPASPSAYFEDLPWQKSIPAPGAIEAPFRTLIVDVGEAAGRDTARLSQLLTTLVTLPGLDVYCVTDAAMELIPGVAILDLSRPDFSFARPEHCPRARAARNKIPGPEGARLRGGLRRLAACPDMREHRSAVPQSHGIKAARRRGLGGTLGPSRRLPPIPSHDNFRDRSKLQSRALSR